MKGPYIQPDPTPEVERAVTRSRRLGWIVPGVLLAVIIIYTLVTDGPA